MKSNPNDRRASESPPGSTYPNAQGMWRDGNLLVVDLQTDRFPLRCVLTNQPVDPPQPPLTLTCHNPPYLELARLQSERRQDGDAKITIIQGHKQSTRVLIDLKIPLCPRWQRRLRSHLGTRLLLVGVALIVLRFASEWLAVQLDISRDFLGRWMWFVIGLTLASGALVLLLQSFILRINRLEERKIWIAGVHRDWLQPLPPFVPSQAMIEKQIFSASGQLWMSITVGAIMLGLVFLTVAQDVKRDGTLQGLITVYLLVAGALVLLGHSASGRIAFLKRRKAELYAGRAKRRR